jgi:hypothetical protein
MDIKFYKKKKIIKLKKDIFIKQTKEIQPLLRGKRGQRGPRGYRGYDGSFNIINDINVNSVKTCGFTAANNKFNIDCTTGYINIFPNSNNAPGSTGSYKDSRLEIRGGDFSGSKYNNRLRFFVQKRWDDLNPEARIAFIGNNDGSIVTPEIQFDELTKLLTIKSSLNNFNHTALSVDMSGNIGIKQNIPKCVLDISTNNTIGHGDFPIIRGAAFADSARPFLTDLSQNATILPMIGSLDNIGNDVSSVRFFIYGRFKGKNYSATIQSENLFTGQHNNFINDININTSNIKNYVGLIVSSADEGYKSIGKDGYITGKNAIWTTESLPIICLSKKDKDPAVWGVITNHANDYNDTNGNHILDDNIDWGNNLNGRIRINGLGEGAIWVTNLNGNFENGDYICSSIIHGYGRKQDDDILHNYTVAKITMSCYFELNQNNYICQEFFYDNIIYRKAYVGCTYHCS